MEIQSCRGIVPLEGCSNAQSLMARRISGFSRKSRKLAALVEIWPAADWAGLAAAPSSSCGIGSHQQCSRSKTLQSNPSARLTLQEPPTRGFCSHESRRRQRSFTRASQWHHLVGIGIVLGKVLVRHFSHALLESYASEAFISIKLFSYRFLLEFTTDFHLNRGD